MVDSRAIDQLNPVVQKMCNAFIAKCKDSGITITITSTYRDNEAQAKLYSQGRPLGKKVTDAKPGQSIHNYRLAFDFAPIYDNKAQIYYFCFVENLGLVAAWNGAATGNHSKIVHTYNTLMA
jgi:hypothetical protein